MNGAAARRRSHRWLSYTACRGRWRPQPVRPSARFPVGHPLRLLLPPRSARPPAEAVFVAKRHRHARILGRCRRRPAVRSVDDLGCGLSSGSRRGNARARAAARRAAGTGGDDLRISISTSTPRSPIFSPPPSRSKRACEASRSRNGGPVRRSLSRRPLRQRVPVAKQARW